MIIRTERKQGGGLYETYRCSGHISDPASCPMVPQHREPIDSAVYSYFERLGADAASSRNRLSEVIDRRVSMLHTRQGDADRGAQAMKAGLRRIKDDYLEGRLTAPEWRGLRDDLQPGATKLAAKRQSLGDQLADLEAVLDVSEAESEIQTQLERVCAAIAAGVEEASNVAAIREALVAMFDRFVLHLGVPSDPELGSEEGWIEGVIDPQRPQMREEKPRPLVVKEALSRLDRSGSRPWVWAVLQGPIAVPEMRTGS